MSQFRHVTDIGHLDTRSVTLAIGRHLDELLPSAHLVSVQFLDHWIFVSYSVGTQRAKVCVQRPTTARRAAQAVLQHFQHFVRSKIEAAVRMPRRDGDLEPTSFTTGTSTRQV